jgi:hypothetical protein
MNLKLTEDSPGDLGTGRVNGPLGSGTGAPITVDFVGQSGGGYKVELDVGGVGTDLGSTLLSFGTTYPMRISSNGTTVTAEIDSGAGLAEECSITDSTLFDRNRITFLKTGVSGVNVFYALVAFYTGDDGDDRPDVDVKTTLRTPNADGTDTDFGNDGGGCAASSGTYDRWDDWDAGGSEDGSTLCAAGGSNENHSSATANYTKTKDTTHLMTMCVTAAAGEGKNPEPGMRINDGSSSTDGDSVVATNTKTGRGYAFTTDAAGAAWGQTGMDNTEIGMNVGGSDNCFCYAVGLEWVEVSDDAGGDPPPSAFLPQVIIF